MTTHSLVENDCRDLSFVRDASVHLIITHPPSLGSFATPPAPKRLSTAGEYEGYLSELEPVLAECRRVLAPGGYFACIASPVARCDEDLPLSADLQARTRLLGLEPARAIRWLTADKVAPDGAAFYGAPNQPCGELPTEGQDILVLRKPGERLVSAETQVASRLPAEFFATCSSSVWLIPADPDPRHPQSFPLELAERLVRMFSYAGDTVLDPFAGIGTTSAAAGMWGRNSIAVEIEQRYFDSMADRMANAQWPDGEISVSRGPLAGRVPAADAELPVV